MYFRLFFYLKIIIIAFSCNSQEYKFAVVGKDDKTPFYQKVKEGCIASAQLLQGVSCIYTGVPDANVRFQSEIIIKAINEGVDAIAIAPIHSGYLKKKSLKLAEKKGIPIITFDSPLEYRDSVNDTSLAYVGSNNLTLGRTLASGLNELRTTHKKYIIITGRKESQNLQKREEGIREKLNKSGWTEVRSPIYTDGKIDKSLEQIKMLFNIETYKFDAVILTGGWPQFNAKKFKAAIASRIEKVLSKKILIVSADFSPSQEKLLSEGLSHLNIRQSAFTMGEESINIMHKIVNNLPFEKITYTKLIPCLKKNLPCRTENKNN